MASSASASDSDESNMDVKLSARPDSFPIWKLLVSALPWIGIQALWSTEFAVTTPYMKDLGMSDAMSSNIWIFGPITGFITAPIVGSLSDRCTSSMGRRRPFILAGLVLLWIASLIFASSKYILPKPHSKWLAFVMFVVLDVVINVIQTPIRAIVSDMASQDQQLHGQIISVLFQGVGTFLGFFIMKMWTVPYQAIFQVMIVILSIVTLFVAIQVCICQEVRYVPTEDRAYRSLASPFIEALRAISNMSPDLAKIAFVQFFSWYALFSYQPTLSTWFSVNVFGGSADSPEGSHERSLYDQGQNKNSDAGLMNAGLQIFFSMMLVLVLVYTKIRTRFVYATCLFVGAMALIFGKLGVGHSVNLAMLMAVLLAIPVSAINAFPFAFVGAMNKRAQSQGREVDTGKQMGVLNIFVCTPQLIATLVIGVFRDHLPMETALPWVFFMAGISFFVAGVGAFYLNDKVVN